jgi:hypothetical protein
MRAYSVCLTDMICADFRKANMVKFALGNELGHYAGALLKGNAVNDTCRLEQVKFLGPTEPGEDEVDFSFECCFTATQVLTTTQLIGAGDAQITIWIERHAALCRSRYQDTNTRSRAEMLTFTERNALSA